VDVTSSTPLTPLTETPAASPEQVLLHPSGDLLYYIDSGGTLHSEFVNSADGSLTSTGLTPTPASNLGSDLYIGVIDPTGRFVYVITNGNSVLYGFKITHTQPSGGTNDGALTAIAGLTAYTDSTLNFPSWIMTDRAGKYLYVVNQGDGVNPSTVSEYSINQSTGALTPLGTPTIPTGVLPEFGTTDVNGHLYVANQGGTSGSVSGYSINSSKGQLSSVGADTVITGASDSINVLTDPTGKYLYVMDFGSTSNGQVFAYNLNTSTGVIGSVIGSPQPTDLSPTGMAIDPTGVLLAIDNFDGADISLYSVNSGTGGLTPTTPATVAAGTKTEFVVFYTAASGQ
jgi:6-phosphogluconolactonase (cycloisomerase 2 family)